MRQTWFVVPIVFVLCLCARGPLQRITNELGMTFVYIGPGTFVMGSEGGNADEQPVHQVTISKGFYMQATEVTVGQFRQFVEERGYLTTAEKEDGTYVLAEGKFEKKEDANWRNPYFLQTDTSPVGCVSWYDAVEFACWLSDETGDEHRLPSEAEWEYACRAGSTTKFHWGDSIDGKYCWFKENSDGTTHAVGTKLPNAWGLHDMIGNVMEACSDLYDDDYYRESPSIDPKGPSSGSEIVARGGNWYFGAEYCRCSARLGGERNVRGPITGFRLAMSVK